MGMACALAAALLGGLLTGCNNQTEAPATVAGFTSLEDLEGHSVAVINGSTSDVLLSDTNNFAHIRLVRCKTPTELFAAISDSVADCGIIDTVVLTTLGMAEHGLAVDFNLPGGFDVAVAFNPRDEKLCQQFNDFLVQIKSDGTLDEMFGRWCSQRLDTVTMPTMDALADLKGHPIEVATLADNAPFSFYKENVWTGLEVEMMLRFSIFAGRPVHFSGYKFIEIIDVLRTHRADVAVQSDQSLYFVRVGDEQQRIIYIIVEKIPDIATVGGFFKACEIIRGRFPSYINVVIIANFDGAILDASTL